jgi:hypothetical protein
MWGQPVRTPKPATSGFYMGGYKKFMDPLFRGVTMTRSAKLSILGAAVISAIAASEARASFTYDLRFAPSSEGISADGRTVTLVDSAGVKVSQTSYTLQLWGRITGDTIFNNDAWNKGFVSVGSAAAGAGQALTSGGITNAAYNTANFPDNARLGAGQDFTGDSISDWGSNTSTNSTQGTKWLAWANVTVNASPGNGFIPDSQNPTTTSHAYAGDPTNSWEVLICSFTVDASHVAAQGDSALDTVFNEVAVPAGVKVTSTSTQTGLIVYQDGSAAAVSTGSIGPGAKFEVAGVPEPASLGVLALGGLSLLARRGRK